MCVRNRTGFPVVPVRDSDFEQDDQCKTCKPFYIKRSENIFPRRNFHLKIEESQLGIKIDKKLKRSLVKACVF